MPLSYPQVSKTNDTPFLNRVLTSVFQKRDTVASREHPNRRKNLEEDKAKIPTNAVNYTKALILFWFLVLCVSNVCTRYLKGK